MKISPLGFGLLGDRRLRFAWRLGVLVLCFAAAGRAFAQLAVTTLAGGLSNPYGVVVDAAGNTYVADTSSQLIRKITQAGVISTLAGVQSSPGLSNTLPGQFSSPRGIAINSAGTVLYVADTGNNAIRAITLTAAGGTVSSIATVAGGGAPGFVNSGAASTFNGPRGIAINSTDTTLYIADTFNHSIRSIVISGTTVTTVAGLGAAGFANGDNLTATFSQPSGLTVNAAGTVLFVADSANHSIRRVVLGTVAVSTYAGTGAAGAVNNATGTLSSFTNPSGVVGDSADNLYVADSGNNAVRFIAAAGTNTVSTPAGGSQGSANGTGVAAQFFGPNGIAARTLSGTFFVFVADTNNQLIRKAATAAAAVVGSPSNQSVLAGANGVAFTATVTGGWPAPTLQWQRNPGGVSVFANLSESGTYVGVTTGTLTVNGVTIGMNNDQFRLVATNSSGTAASPTAATMSVNLPPTAPTFATPTVTFVASVGQAASFPNPATGSSPITYSVTSGSLGIFSLNASTGTITSTTNPSSTADSTIVTLTASNGTLPNATRTVTIDVVLSTAPVITAQPQPVVLTTGQTIATFSVSATGTPAITNYQWERQIGGVGAFVALTDGTVGTTTFSGTSGAFATTLTINGVTPSMNGDVYHVVVTNGPGSSTTSNPASLTLPPTIISAANTSFAINQFNQFVFAATGTPTPFVNVTGTLPTGVTFVNGVLSGVPTTTVGSPFFLTVTATSTAGTTNQSFTLEVSLPQAPTVTSGSSTTFVVNQPASFTFTAFGSPAPVISLAGNIIPSGLTFSNNVLSGTPLDATGSPFTYTVTASNSSGTSFPQTFVLTILGVAPTFNTQPVNAAVNVGGTITFTASATGTPVPTLRWQRQPSGTFGFVDLFDTANYSGTQTGTLTITNVDSGMSGDQYRLVATNNSTVNATSQAATLTVNLGTAITTIAGQAQFFGGVDGTGAAARFNAPSGLAIDPSGNVYIADTANHIIRRMTPNGVVTTIAGQPGLSGNADGASTVARFASPQGVAVDFAGNVYVADTFNHTIRVITTSGNVTTLAGLASSSGASDGVGNLARFFQPSGIAIDSSGTLYVSDTANHAIRRVLSNGTVATIAGTLNVPGYIDNPTGTFARFNSPAGIAVDINGNLYVADSQNHVIRKITGGTSVTTLAGLGGVVGIVDGNSTSARFNRPNGVAVDTAGNVYVADTLSSTLRKITAAGDVTTLAGQPTVSGIADGFGTTARFNQPFAVAIDISGNIYVADTRNHTIRKNGVASAPQILLQPANRVAGLGQSVTFTASATGAPTPGYQWQRQAANNFGIFTTLSNDSVYSGVTTGTLTIANVTSEMNGDQFRIIANNGVLPVAISNPGVLTIGSPPVFTSPATATFQAQQAGSFTVTVNSAITASFSATGLPSWASLNSSTGQITGTPPDTNGSPFTVTVSASNGATATQALVITVTPAVLPPTIAQQPTGATVNQSDTAAFSVSVNGTAPFSYQWLRNGAAISGATVSTLQLPNVQNAAAGIYSVRITNAVGNVVSSGATLTINSVPVFTSQPRTQTALLGETVTFSVSAVGGSVGFGYQWRKNGTPIAGANGSTLTLPNVSPADAGSYDVQITNPFGLGNSSLAQLTVVTTPAAPVITAQPAARVVVSGAPATFTVGASGAPSPGYQWRKNGTPISGANGPTLTLAGVGSNDAANYDVVVSNSAGNVTSAPAGLTVLGRSYAGFYFGSYASSLGDFALYVREDNTGVFLSYLPGSQAPAMSLSVRVNDAGQFSFSQVAIPAASVEGEPARAAALQPVTVNGTIAADGAVSGAIQGGANATLSGARASDAGGSQGVVGYYQAGAPTNGAASYTIAGPSNVAFVVVQSGASSDGGRGSVTSFGALSVATNRSVITETINGPAGTITGASSGGVNATLTGASDVALARQRLVNISSRARVATGDAVAIAGFVISGEESKPVLIRAVGPTIGAAPFSVPGALASPRLELFRGATLLAVNTGIAGNRVTIDAAGVQAGAFALGSAGTDAALLTTLAPGNYTAVVSSSTNTAGVALVEVYDLSSPTPGQKLLNIATRAPSGVGDNSLIAGFVVPPGPSKRVLVRGVGPGLTVFGVTGVLAQPSLNLFNGPTTVAQNTNWVTSVDAAAITSASNQAGAFGLATNDSAILVTLAPGSYTAQVVGVGGTTGVALIEVYEVP